MGRYAAQAGLGCSEDAPFCRRVGMSGAKRHICPSSPSPDYPPVCGGGMAIRTSFVSRRRPRKKGYRQALSPFPNQAGSSATKSWMVAKCSAQNIPTVRKRGRRPQKKPASTTETGFRDGDRIARQPDYCFTTCTASRCTLPFAPSVRKITAASSPALNLKTPRL